ncbi:MAG: formylglycine-generating enzyme family protein [Treponema sp.]|jgi:formylglycine-generating enzyme required for sulfatase activity|nr:formylglycine-generating enzyme family protein [Treponema sp.]
MLKKRLFGMMTLIVGIMLIFTLIACDDSSGGGGTGGGSGGGSGNGGGSGGGAGGNNNLTVTFDSVTADGSAAQTTTQLTLTFDKAINGLTADDITLSGVNNVSKGTLSGSNPYILPISGFAYSGTLSVEVAKSGYTINGSPKTVSIRYGTEDNTPIILSVTADGSSAQATTQLTFTLDNAISGLSASDIILSGVDGVSKGTLSGSNPYTLPISGFTSNGNLSVIVSKLGYYIYNSPSTVSIYYGPITLNSVTANGSSTQTTTQLTLTFDKAVPGLTASDISLSGVSGVSKGMLSGSNPYTLLIDGFTLSGNLSVAISRSPYVINGSPKTVDIYYKLVIEMVQIPGGSFDMGSDSGFDEEKPVHTVTLSSFYMGKYEVTQEQWAAVMGNNPSHFKDSPASGEIQRKRPVERVSWYDALVFCNKLSIKEGLTPAYSISGKTDPADWGTVPTSYNATWNDVVIIAGSTGYRLPTEAQWEYACRAGTTTAYNTGDTISDNTGWYLDNSGDKTHEVGKKPANAWGLYDMHGNVSELCWDWFGDYTSATQMNPTGAVTGSYRVRRGGNWDYFGLHLRSASRSIDSPNSRGNNVGFRLVRS